MNTSHGTGTKRASRFRLFNLVLCALLGCAACGDEGAQSSFTMHSAYWRSFEARLTERALAPKIAMAGDLGLLEGQREDVWHIDGQGLAEYSTAWLDGAGNGRKTVVVSHQMQRAAFERLKNTLAHPQVFAWPDVFGESDAQDSGCSSLYLDLDGHTKNMVWPLDWAHVPEEIADMGQQIKDAVEP